MVWFQGNTLRPGPNRGGRFQNDLRAVCSDALSGVLKDGVRMAERGSDSKISEYRDNGKKNFVGIS